MQRLLIHGQYTAMSATPKFIGLAENPHTISAEVAFRHSAIQGYRHTQSSCSGVSPWPIQLARDTPALVASNNSLPRPGRRSRRRPTIGLVRLDQLRILSVWSI